MRQSLVFQGLEAVARNSKHKQPDLRLFEFGRTYTQHDVTDKDGTVRKAYDEKEHLSLWVTGRDKPETWNAPKGKDGQADMFTLKHAVESLLAKVGLNVFSEAESDTDGLLAEDCAPACERPRGRTLGSGAAFRGPGLRRGCACVLGRLRRRQTVESGEEAPREGARTGAVPRGAARFGLGGGQVCGLRSPEGGRGKSRAKLLKGVELFDVYEGKGSKTARRATPWRSPCRTPTPR